METARRKLGFASDATDEGLAYWSGEGLRSSPFVSPDEAPYARLGLEESDEDGEGEREDVMDEGQKIRRDEKVRKYGFSGRGSIGRVKLSTDMNGNCEAGGGGPGSSAGSKVWSGLGC